MDSASEVVIGKEDIGGIPLDRFKTGITKELIAGASGQTKLECTIDNGWVNIIDKSDPKFCFVAYLDGTVLQLTMNNKGWEGDPNKKHPDIFPAKLVKATIQEFERQGRVVEEIQGRWRDEPNGEMMDNLNAFNDYLAGLGKVDITKEDQKEAAKRTPTGMIAASVGYTEVADVYPSLDPGDIELMVATFRKPKPATQMSQPIQPNGQGSLIK